ATWADDSSSSQKVRKVNFHLLDRNGKVLVRIKDFASRPFQPPPMITSLPALQNVADAVAAPEMEVSLQSLLPIWNAVRLDPAARITVPEASNILMLGGGPAELAWVAPS